MNNSEWRLLCVSVPCTDSEIVSDFLWSRGVVAIEEIVHSDMVELRTSYGDEVDQLAREVLHAFPNANVSIADAERDVSDTWREFVEPTVIDTGLRIVPSWHSHDTQSGVDDVLIDPEDVFGLGNHPTTVGALRLGRRHVPPHSTLFDYGCGSGVLAIAMSKTHDCTPMAYDIADNAQEIVTRNAHRNGVEVQWSEPGSRHDSLNYRQIDSARQFDVVMANILAPVLREIAPTIQAMTHNGSLIILSGMRTDQIDSVMQQYAWCDLVDRCEIEGWVSVCLQVRG